VATTAKAVTVLEIGDEAPFLVPVSLKHISTSSDVSLESASPRGNAVGQVYVDLITAEPVKRDEIRKGIFRSKRSKKDKETWSDFAEISADDIAIIDDATALDTFRIEHFIPLADVPFERVTDAFFLAPPDGMTPKPLLLLAAALKRSKQAGVFKMTKTKRQYLAVVYEKNGGLIVNTLAYAGDFAAVREAAEALDRHDVKVTPAEKALATELVLTLGADPMVLDAYEDEAVVLKQDLVERALRGEKLTARKKREIAPPTDDGLEAALRASLPKKARSGEPVGV
jgi:non-homologous end joining protein Ku